MRLRSSRRTRVPIDAWVSTLRSWLPSCMLRSPTPNYPRVLSRRPTGATQSCSRPSRPKGSPSAWVVRVTSARARQPQRNLQGTTTRETETSSRPESPWVVSWSLAGSRIVVLMVSPGSPQGHRNRRVRFEFHDRRGVRRVLSKWFAGDCPGSRHLPRVVWLPLR